MPAAVKWSNPDITAEGKARAKVTPATLETLWFNTGTLCNLECLNCYIESSPKNDRLVYITTAEVEEYLEEISSEKMQTREIAFTGGEPFLNPHMCAMAEAALSRGYRVMILTNAMQPLKNKRADLLVLKERFGDTLRLRASLDHYTEKIHNNERGAGAWEKALDGISWLAEKGFSLSIAGRSLTDESNAHAQAGYQKIFDRLNWGLQADNPEDLVIFPEMTARMELPEITTQCWGLLKKEPSSVMCASSRMVVKRRGDEKPTVAACTLLPYDQRFSMGQTLKDAWRPVSLTHPHCAAFCVLGGASCSG